MVGTRRLGAIRAARRVGLSVPTDVSVVGYDDSPLMTCTEPPLTTVRQPIEAMGRAAVELLANQIAGTPVPDAWSLQNPVLYTLIWTALILAVFVPLSVRLYQRTATR